ncbi:unnamed protein product [Victoria cruziana]
MSTTWSRKKIVVTGDDCGFSSISSVLWMRREGLADIMQNFREHEFHLCFFIVAEAIELTNQPSDELMIYELSHRVLKHWLSILHKN